MSNSEIIRCQPKDLIALQSLSIQTFSDTYQEKNTKENFDNYIDSAFNKIQLQKELSTKGSHFYFVYFEKCLAGYFKLNEPGAQSDLNEKNTIELERIYLKNDFKGLGLGKSMIAKSIEVGKELGFQKIWLGVWEENPNAILFYERMGFKKAGTHTFTVGDDVQLDFVYEYEL